VRRSMWSRATPVLALLTMAGARLAAQIPTPSRDSTRVLVLEHRFTSDSSDTLVLTLDRSLVYQVEITGPGTPVFQAARRGQLSGFVVPLAEGGVDQPRRFEVYAVRSGLHRILLTDIPSGAVATLRLYNAISLARHIEERRDRAPAVGIQVGGGIHGGYRLDPTGGADPRGGSDAEGCVLVEAANRVGACLGFSRQAFPDAGFGVTWAFLEERTRIATSYFLGGRRTDLAISLRLSTALAAGPRGHKANLLSLGLLLTQRLASKGHRRGLSIFLSWQHTRLGNALETELLDSNRLIAGFAWVP